MVTFNIVEGNSTQEYKETYEQIKQDIQDGLKTTEIMVKHNLTTKSWKGYREQLTKEGIYKTNRYAHAKYYYKNRDTYIVTKRIKNDKIYRGCFKTEQEAQRCVELMKERNWEKEQFLEVLEILENEFSTNYTIQKKNLTG